MNKNKTRLYEWGFFLGEMLCVFLAIYLIQSLLFSWALIHGSSMEPTFYERDVVLFSKTGKNYSRGSIVVCHSGKGLEGELIKRVVGVPGDVIEIDGDTHQVLVNGEAIEETYLQEATYKDGDITYPAKVPPGQYFVLGDNRGVSLDSRYSEVGTLPKENIEGKVFLRIFPLTKIQWFH